MERVTHLRIYTLQQEIDATEWLEEFRRTTYRLRRAHGFQLDGMWLTTDPPTISREAGGQGEVRWVTDTKRKFVYTVSYEGTAEDWEVKNRRYYEAPEFSQTRALNKGISQREMWFVSQLGRGLR